MKKGILTIFILSLFVFNINDAHSFGGASQIIKGATKKYKIKVSGIGNYPPFSWVAIEKGTNINGFYSVYMPLIDKLTESGNVEAEFNSRNTTLDEILKYVREDEGDIVVGALSQSEKFKDIALIYPAPLYNPITVFMLPNKISQVKSINDLKNLKGIRYSHEILSDFIHKQILSFNMEETDSSYEMFKKLFNQEADYILCGYYFGIIEATKLGVKHQIAPANKALWNLPMFVGVSKMSKNRKILSENLSKLLNNEENVKALKDNINKIISQFEEENKGRVPETFGLENKQ